MKKSLLILTLHIVLCINTFASVKNDSNLNRGNILSVRLITEVSSNNKAGSIPSAIVENDVRTKDGDVLIKRGTPVLLQTEKKKSKAIGKPGYISIKCISTSSVDNQTIMLEGYLSKEGENKKGLALGLGIGLGWLFLPGLGFLALQGDQAIIEANTLIPNVFIMNDYNITF